MSGLINKQVGDHTANIFLYMLNNNNKKHSYFSYYINLTLLIWISLYLVPFMERKKTMQKLLTIS